MMDPDVIRVLLASLILGAGSTWLARRIARRLGIVNHPNAIVVQHTRPVAYLGGAGIALGVAAALFLAGVLWSVPRAALARPDLIVGGTFFLVLGLADDLRPFRPLPKFAFQLLGAAGVVYLRSAAEGFDPVFAFLSVIWIVTLVNAVNLTDVCDGLVAGLACIQFVALALLVPSASTWSLAIAGACAGFMLFNAPAASIFLGDAGSHLLGFWLAILTLDLVTSSYTATSIAQALLIAGIPLFELIFVSTMRIQKGLPWWRGSADHFSLRLQSSGFSRWATDSLAWTGMALLAALAWLLQSVSMLVATALVACLGLLLVWCWSYLRRCESQV